MISRRMRRVGVTLLAPVVLLPPLVLFIRSHPRDFEKLYLKLAGAVIGGVKDHLGGFIAASVIALVVIWLLIGVSCFVESRRESPPHDMCE